MSLIEGNDQKNNILLRIKRAIPLTILKNNLIRTYELYNKLYAGEYSDACLNHFDEKVDESKPPENSEFIMENGFYVYILMNYIVKIEVDSNEYDEEDGEIEEFLIDLTNSSKDRFTIFGEITALVKNVLQAAKGYWFKLKKSLASKKTKKSYMKMEVRLAQKKQLIREVLSFFSNFVKHIEINRDGQLWKIFFPLLPMCKRLPKEIKEEFNENVNRVTNKIKVEELMIAAPLFLKIMRHEEKLRLFFNRNKMIGILANREKLWKQCAFYINISINCIIIVSYTSKFVPIDATPAEKNYIRLNEPYFFENKEFDKTVDIIVALGTINLVLGLAVVFLFLIKKAPLIIDHIWKGFFVKRNEMSIFLKIWVCLKNILISFYICLFDGEFLYYIIYTLMIISGLIIHPFFFVFNLTDFLRIDELKNVIKAVWIPRKQLLLVLFLFSLVEYYFTIFGYIELWDQYNNHCNRLWICAITNFDETFKVIF